MANQPVVSVCMITYNHEAFIQKAIEGVLMQETDFDIELIISNDCSKDKTDFLIRKLISENDNFQFKYFEKTKNLGMMPNFIFALKQCKGKYIALCEGDDYWTDPLKLQKQVDFLQANADYGLCFHAVDLLTEKEELIEDFITSVPENPENMESLARYGNYIHTPSVVFRNIFKDYPFELLEAPFGDYFLYMMLAQEGRKIKYVPEIMGVYRYGVGIISKKSELALANSNILLYSCMISYVKEEAIKKILLQRQTDVLLRYSNQVQKRYKGGFSSNHFIFKRIKFLQTALRHFRMKRNKN